MRKALLFIALFFLTIEIFAQYRTERYDTSYYMSYRNKLTLGAVAIKKSTVFKTGATDADQALRFRPNSPGRLGISVAHDFIGLSATFGVNGLDPSYSENKGKTRQTNLQMSVTGRKVLADIYFQKYKGLYLNTDPVTGIAPSGNKYYIRPDIETALYGTTVNLIGNSRKFSAQAAFLLDAWQKKSAGSLLYGGEFFYGSAKGDSAFIPSALANTYPHSGVSKINFITFGPGLGYGYTLVLSKHFFITGMASVNADVSYIKEWEKTNGQNSFWKFNPNLKAKGAIGYNTENWGIGLSYVSNRLFFTGIDTDSRYLNYNDNYKLMYVRRINAGKAIPKITGFASRIINAAGLGFLINQTDCICIKCRKIFVFLIDNYNMSIMIRTVIRPQKRHIQLDIPKEYIGKEIEITYIPLDEVNQASDNKPVKKMKDFWGSISDDTATKLHKHISQSRAEWKRDI